MFFFLDKVMAAVFVINLARSTLRLQQTQTRLNQVNLSFERIDAIDGAALSDAQKLKHYSPQLNSQQYYYPLSDGQIGCYLSHRKAWQRIIDQKLDYAIVLEDDFYIDESIHTAIKNIENLNFPWQLIKLSAYQSRYRPIAFSSELKDGQDIVIHKKLMTGCCATAISFLGAQQLLKATEQFGRPVDSDLQHCWETNVFGYSLMPYPIRQDEDIKSDIKARSTQLKVKKAFFKRKLQQAKEKVRNKIATNHFIKSTKLAIKNQKNKRSLDSFIK
jgi:glycosyl transferase family 25